MTTTTTFDTSDFDDIVSGLQRFMQSQDTLKDYNFNGSGLKAILRVLGYNTQQLAFQNNFAINELNWDSAALRANLASQASRIGYAPSSITCSKIGVTVVVTPSDLSTASSTLTMDQNVRFLATKDNAAYTFSPDKTYTASLDQSAGTYTFTDVTLIEGTLTTSSFTVQTANGVESYEIQNASIDTATLSVAVKDSASATNYTTFSPFTNAYDLGADSDIYFLRQNRSGLFELEFGDGRIGTQLTYGQVIVASYMVTNGASANGISALTPSTGIGGQYNITLTIEDGVYSSGGAAEEDIETIRKMGPKTWASGGAATTDSDYVTFVKKVYDPTAQVIAWGGEYNDPPKYGYTYISVIPTDGTVLSDATKAEIVSDLQQYNVGSITPVVVDPTYLYLNLTSDVHYVSKQTILTEQGLKGKISSYLTQYSSDNLELFNSSFDLGVLVAFINKIDKSIQRNFSQITYERRFVPILATPSSYSFNFYHAIEPGSVSITGFRVADTDYTGAVYSIVDDGLGSLTLQKVQNSTTINITKNFGTVDYTTGLVSIALFSPNSILNSSYVTVTASPANGVDPAISGVRNTVLLFNNININMVTTSV